MQKWEYRVVLGGAKDTLEMVGDQGWELVSVTGNLPTLYFKRPHAPKLEANWEEPNVTIDWKHVANEWADMATNGLQWLRNIKEGVSTVDEALKNMHECLDHCQDVASGNRIVHTKKTKGPPPPISKWEPKHYAVKNDRDDPEYYKDAPVIPTIAALAHSNKTLREGLRRAYGVLVETAAFLTQETTYFTRAGKLQGFAKATQETIDKS